MKNKMKLKRTLVYILCVAIISIIVTLCICYYQYRAYTNNFNNKITQVINSLIKKYPDVSENEIIEILNSENNTDVSLFNKYGIDLKKDSILIINDRYFICFLVFNILFVAIIILLVSVLFLRYNKEKDKNLNEITKYIEEINNRNYKLDIDDNTEDELSILKNEVYKTTIMLKEVAENSKQDKLNLKNSLSDISHQLKTPLTSITILIDNIIENKDMDSKTRDEFAKDIKREILNINFLVQALLKLSKLDADAVSFMDKEVNVSDIINGSVKNVAALCDLKNININVKGNSNSKVCCDLKWQIEAITNILKNCVEHSYNNSTIEIYYEENNVYSMIEIKDFGVGIGKEDLTHIFERFYKGKNSSNDSIGIGLALAKSIVERNNGNISVTSEFGKETIFSIKYFKY